MRLGLYGLSGQDAAGAPWRALAAAVDGVVTEAVAVGAGGPDDVSADASGAARARWDAVLVCGAVAVDAGAAAAGTLPAALQILVAFARAGGPVLGAGGGFQSLCALGLLPGRVMAPAAAPGSPASDARQAVVEDPAAHLRVEGRRTPFTSAIPAGRVMRLHDATTAAAGLRYDVAEPEALAARGQVIFRYCDAAGGTRARPRGQAIAGVCDDAGNVVGLLADPAVLGGDGAQLLGSLRLHLGRRR